MRRSNKRGGLDGVAVDRACCQREVHAGDCVLVCNFTPAIGDTRAAATTSHTLFTNSPRGCITC